MSATWESPVLGLYDAKAKKTTVDGCAIALAYDAQQPEYECLRRGIGLVDANHYGKFEVKGPAALDVVNRVVLADVSRLAINRMLVSYMLKPDGSVRCELYVVNLPDGFLLLSVGAPPEEVLTVLKEESRKQSGSATVTDLTRDVGLVELDGPFAWELLKDQVGVGILGARFLSVLEEQSITEIPTTVFRAGKTGEFGYLLKTAANKVRTLWERLLEAGKDYDTKPCGSAAVDLCKLENRVLNMSREGRRADNVLELNCRYMVSRDKDDYIGAEAVKAGLAEESPRRLIGVTMDWPGASPTSGPALDSEILHQGMPIGVLANAGYSYQLGKQIGLAFIHSPFGYVGLDYTLKADGTQCNARTVSAPFVMNRSLSIRPQEDSYRTSR